MAEKRTKQKKTEESVKCPKSKKKIKNAETNAGYLKKSATLFPSDTVRV